MMTATNLSQELTRIVEQEAIKVLFQPIFNLSTGQVHGFEALSRGPTNSQLHSPVPLFKIAAAEERLSELEEICRRHSIHQFHSDKLPGRLFINISPKALLEPRHAKGLTLHLVQELGLKPDQIVIELSEQYPADDIELLKSCLNHYRSQRFLTAIDDLGTGYSGLRLWSELAPDYVKIDRHFIHRIDRTPVKQEFVRSIIDLCQNLSCEVIAEGIETQAELNTLSRLGIHLCQGYLLGRPQRHPRQELIRQSPHQNSRLSSFRHQGRDNQQEHFGLAASLVSHTLTVPPQTKLKTIRKQFLAEPALLAIAVIDKQGVIGMIERGQLLGHSSRLTLEEDLTAAALMKKRVLMVQAKDPLSWISQQLISTPQPEIAQQFIVIDDHHFLGIGHTKDLLLQITEQAKNALSAFSLQTDRQSQYYLSSKIA